MKLLFRMTPQGPFYNGSQFLHTFDTPFPRSDMLFKAMLHAWHELWGQPSAQALVQKYLHAAQEADLPFYISNIFPAIGTTYFLPRPLCLEFGGGSGHDRALAQSKEAMVWISADIYREWLSGQAIPWNPEHVLFPGLYCHAQAWNDVKGLLQDKIAWSDDEGRLRNVAHPSDLQETVYPANQIFYAHALDWYLLVHTQEEYRQPVAAVLRLLGDEGIGGRRSVGCGGYRYQEPTPMPPSLDFVAAPVANSFTTLSLYYPTGKDVEQGVLQQARFQLLDRQGWHNDPHGHPQRQQRVRLVREGACFQHPPSALTSLVATGQDSYHYVYPFRIAAPTLA